MTAFRDKYRGASVELDENHRGVEGAKYVLASLKSDGENDIITIHCESGSLGLLFKMADETIGEGSALELTTVLKDREFDVYRQDVGEVVAFQIVRWVPSVQYVLLIERSRNAPITKTLAQSTAETMLKRQNVQEEIKTESDRYAVLKMRWRLHGPGSDECEIVIFESHPTLENAVRAFAWTFAVTGMDNVQIGVCNLLAWNDVRAGYDGFEYVSCIVKVAGEQ